MTPNRADATDIEIALHDQPDGATRIDIEHTGWHRLGARGPARRDATRAGWDGLLPHFILTCSTYRGNRAASTHLV